MPILTTPAELQSHIRAALGGRDHWVFMTADDDQGRQVARFILGGLANAGLTDEQVTGAAFDWLLLPSRRTTPVIVLTVRKSDLPRSWVAAFLVLMQALLPVKVPPLTAEQDLFTMSDHPERLAGLLQQIVDGSATGYEVPTAAV